MSPDFLAPERKKYNFLEKLTKKKIQKNFTVYNNNNSNNNNNNNNNNKIIRA